MRYQQVLLNHAPKAWAVKKAHKINAIPYLLESNEYENLQEFLSPWWNMARKKSTPEYPRYSRDSHSFFIFKFYVVASTSSCGLPSIFIYLSEFIVSWKDLIAFLLWKRRCHDSNETRDRLLSNFQHRFIPGFSQSKVWMAQQKATTC